MPRVRRNYTPRTLKLLFARSGNQCAHPQCTTALIEEGTEESEECVTARICHIYPVAETGPRGDSDQPNRALNLPGNLILLCPTHHAVVDGQFETYPAELLKKWKRDHEAAMKSRLSTDLDLNTADLSPPQNYPTALVDQQINEEVDILRKSRSYTDFNGTEVAIRLSERLIKGELSAGSSVVRGGALAWCVRVLSATPETERAEEYLQTARELADLPEIHIASAFLLSKKGERQAALSILAETDSPMARSAAFMVVSQHEGPLDAIAWLTRAGIDPKDLDHDGKRHLLGCQLELEDWEGAQASLGLLTDEDLCNSPILNHLVAITNLLIAVPAEFRKDLLQRPPFQADDFPLASEPQALEARRKAQGYFNRGVVAAKDLNCPTAEKSEKEYALWLALRDPDMREEGKGELTHELRGPTGALHLVPLGVQFGVDLDVDSVNAEIERQIAFYGTLTSDAALARLALVFLQEPEDAARYIARHMEELAAHVEEWSLRRFQIELYVKAGLVEKASECLDALPRESLSATDRDRIENIISETPGEAPVEASRRRFEETNSLHDLRRLVEDLVLAKDSKDCCKYGRMLFERTHDVGDAEKYALALHVANRNEELRRFLSDNETFLGQSKRLQLLDCWALYLVGDLLRARSELSRIDHDWNDENYRKLKTLLAISLGDWESLTGVVASECEQKAQRTPRELMATAQFAANLELDQHARELVFEAVGRAGDDAQVFVNAYLIASKAGWEDDIEVSQWIDSALSLSEGGGPLNRMEVKDLLDHQSEWEVRQGKIGELLDGGEIPMFLAGHHLNRSIGDVMFASSLLNRAQDDPRRRQTVFAYSGVRRPIQIDAKQIGIDVTAILTLGRLELLQEALAAFDKVHIPHSTLAWLFEEKERMSFHQPSRIKEAREVVHLLARGALERYSAEARPDSDLHDQAGGELAELIAQAESQPDGDECTRCYVVRPSPVYRSGSLMEEKADLESHARVLVSCQSVVDKLRSMGRITTAMAERGKRYLDIHEEPWPNQPEVVDGATLYLDSLAHYCPVERFEGSCK